MNINIKKIIVEKSGFTLIELLTVITIIGILMTIAIPNFVRYRDKAKMATLVAALRHVRLAQEVYFNDNNLFFSLNGGIQIVGSSSIPVDGMDIKIDIPSRQIWSISIPDPPAPDGTLQYTVTIQTDFDLNQNGSSDWYQYYKKSTGTGETIEESNFFPLLPLAGT